MKTITHPIHPVHVGIDVAKDTLQVDLQGHSLRLPNTGAGHAEIVNHLPLHAMVVMEATGSYHLALLGTLQGHGIPAAVVNPTRVRQFARARGTMAKTDPVDAALLSAFGRAMEPAPTEPIDPQRVLLRELVGLRDTLLEDVIRWKNMAGHHQSPEARRMALARAKSADKALANIQDRIAALMKHSPVLAPVARVMEQCQGVGPVTSAVLLAEMPELGRIGRRQAASLAGLAPCANDSGKHEGKRMIRGGRPRIRRALYLAALSALRHHPQLKSFYRALRGSGKPAKVAIIAVARKLLVILNAKVKEFHDRSVAEGHEGLPRMGP
jgi:transposase